MMSFLPLPIVLSKHFNHPHPYIEIATLISDRASQDIQSHGLGGRLDVQYYYNYGLQQTLCVVTTCM